MNILAVGAHPDDIEFGCGAVLIKEAKKGNKLKNLVLTLGEAGTRGTPKIRKKESECAAKVLGAEIEFLGLKDSHVQYLPQNAFKIARVIRQFQPDIVLATHPHENQHPDHSVCGKLTRDAVRFARYKGIKELAKFPIHKPKALYFFGAPRPLRSDPDILIDVADVIDDWKKLMLCHKSQLTEGFAEMLVGSTRMLGMFSGVPHTVGLYANDAVVLNRLSDIKLPS